jgi:transposase
MWQGSWMRRERDRLPHGPVRFGYRPPSIEKLLGALPVIATFCRRLDVAGIIDRAAPMRTEVARVSHGQVIEALIANRLTSPTPLLHVAEWAGEWAVEEVWGIAPDALNDDRIARALDAIAPQLEQLVGSVGAQAISAFGIDVARCHWDMTSISVYGAYAEVEEGYATPRWGHPKDRRPDLKQVQTGIATAADGGVPVLGQAYDGGAGEVAQVIDAMTRLKELAGPRELLMVGDSKLISRDNLAALNRARVDFIAPASKTYLPASRLAALELAQATPVGYVAQRDVGKPASRRARYHAIDGELTIPGKRKTDPGLRVRCVFVHSSARAQAAVTARVKRLERARGDLERLGRGLGGRHYPTEAAVGERVATIARIRRVAGVLTSTVGTDPATGKPTLTWEFDQAALAAEAATDGWYGLLTSLTPDQADAAAILTAYKGQDIAERRYAAFKGPLAVAPMFLNNNRRIAALITVICLALLIFCLVERAVRLALAPATRLWGLYADRAVKPTGRLIFAALSRLRLHPARGPDPPAILQPVGIQARLLELLDIDPTRPRWA